MVHILLVARIIFLCAMILFTIYAFKVVYEITYKNELSPVSSNGPVMKRRTNTTRTSSKATSRKTAPAKIPEFQKIDNRNSYPKRTLQKTVSYSEYRKSASK